MSGGSEGALRDPGEKGGAARDAAKLQEPRGLSVEKKLLPPK